MKTERDTEETNADCIGASRWIVTYSLSRVNRQWTMADHWELEHAFQEVDKTVQAVHGDACLILIGRLMEALAKSVQLQSYYAWALNIRDGGTRKTFSTAKEWMDNLQCQQCEM